MATNERLMRVARTPMATAGPLRSTRSPQACFDALTDVERLPEWQGAVRGVEVLERDAAGRGTTVEYLGGDFRDFCGE